jgi:hypothetical protein
MSSIPKRVRVVILGGGLHGLGVFQSIVNRGWDDVIVFDEKRLSSSLLNETTPKFDSLFSLFNFDDFKLLSSAKKEIAYLERALPCSVIQQNFVMPFHWIKRTDSILYRSAFALYSYLIKSTRLQSIKPVNNSPLGLDIRPKPNLYILDDFLVDSNALHRNLYKDLNAYRSLIKEGYCVESIRPSKDGWYIDYKDPDGQLKTISTLFVVNAMGSDRLHFINRHLGAIRSGIEIIETHRFFFEAEEMIDSAILLPQDGLKTATRIYPMGKKNLLTIDRKMTFGKSEKISDKELKQYLRSIQSQLKANFSIHIKEESLERKDISTKIFRRSKRDSDFRMFSKSPHRVFQQRSGRGIAFTIFQPNALFYRAVAEYIGDQMVVSFGDELNAVVNDETQ